MQFRSRKKKILGASAVVVLLLALGAYAAIVHMHAPHKLGSVPAAPLNARLKIPSLRIDSKIESVGLTSAGAMEAPGGPQGVAWYSLGTRPGEEGSAVLAGHRGWKKGIPAVFDHLDTLRKGDTILIADANGKTLTFVVRTTRVYTKDEAPPEVFTSSSGVHLNLITCMGDWNASLKSTTERLVVFTDLQS